MSDKQYTATFTLSGNEVCLKKSGENMSFSIKLHPSEHGYAEFSYAELLNLSKEKLKTEDHSEDSTSPSETDSFFQERERRSFGYDKTDSFIDDDVPYDEKPKPTECEGFHVNTGKLQLKKPVRKKPNVKKNITESQGVEKPCKEELKEDGTSKLATLVSKKDVKNEAVPKKGLEHLESKSLTVAPRTGKKKSGNKKKNALLAIKPSPTIQSPVIKQVVPNLSEGSPQSSSTSEFTTVATYKCKFPPMPKLKAIQVGTKKLNKPKCNLPKVKSEAIPNPMESLTYKDNSSSNPSNSKMQLVLPKVKKTLMSASHSTPTTKSSIARKRKAGNILEEEDNKIRHPVIIKISPKATKKSKKLGSPSAIVRPAFISPSPPSTLLANENQNPSATYGSSGAFILILHATLNPKVDIKLEPPNAIVNSSLPGPSQNSSGLKMGQVKTIDRNLKKALLRFKRVVNTRKLLSKSNEGAILTVIKKIDLLLDCQRQVIVNYMASVLRCSVVDFEAILQKISHKDADMRLALALNEFSCEVNAAMVTLIESHQSKTVVYEKNATTDDDDIQLIGEFPAKVFQWNKKTLSSLKTVICAKKNHYELNKATIESQSQYVNDFLEKDLLKLWPKGWMTMCSLKKKFREACDS